MQNTTKTKPHAPRRRFNPTPRLQPGAAPGTVMPLKDSAPASVSVLTVNHGQVSAPVLLKNLKQLPLPDPQGSDCLWVRVCGLGAVEPLLEIAKHYELSGLALADAINPGWRSKMEENGPFLFFVLQAPTLLDGCTKDEHLSLFCKNNLILTFEAAPTTLVDALWERLASTAPPARIEHQAGFLSYMLLDLIIDRFFPILDQKNEALAALEDALNRSTPDQAELRQLHEIKRDILTLRRLLFPYKELGAGLKNHRLADETKDLQPFLEDLRGHVLQAADLIDAYHEVANSLSNIYQTALSNRMNDIMKILTIISTVFMPLAFITGLYGMNFDGGASSWNMPELRSQYGYPLVLLAMAGVVGAMLWFFKRKKWL